MSSITSGAATPVQVLLVEDNAGDARLVQEAFLHSHRPIKLHVASDGVEAMRFLRREPPFAGAPRPDFILLDLDLPRMDGLELLARIKQDQSLRAIPAIILTTSSLEADIMKSYQFNAACYLTKPADAGEFDGVVKSIADFWLTKAKLPPSGLGL